MWLKSVNPLSNNRLTNNNFKNNSNNALLDSINLKISTTMAWEIFINLKKIKSISKSKKGSNFNVIELTKESNSGNSKNY